MCAQAETPQPKAGRLRRLVRPSNRNGGPAARWRRQAPRLVLTAVGLVTGGLAALAVAKLGVGRVTHAVAGVNVLWLLAAVALDGASLVMRAVSWRALLRAAAPEVDPGQATVILATMIGVLGSAVAPARAGEPLRSWLIARRTSEPRRMFGVVVGTVFSQTLLNLAGLAGLAAYVFASTGLLRGHASAVAISIAVPLAIAGLVVSAPPLIRRAARSRWPLVARTAHWLHREATSLRRGLRAFRDPRHGPLATVCQLAAWAIQLLAVYTISLALGVEGKGGFAAAAAVLLAVNITAVTPLTPSNLGVFQAATIVVLAAFGVSAGRALAYGVLLQAVEIATAFLLGIPALVGEGLHWQDLRGQHRAEERASPTVDRQAFSSAAAGKGPGKRT